MCGRRKITFERRLMRVDDGSAKLEIISLLSFVRRRGPTDTGWLLISISSHSRCWIVVGIKLTQYLRCDQRGADFISPVNGKLIICIVLDARKEFIHPSPTKQFIHPHYSAICRGGNVLKIRWWHNKMWNSLASRFPLCKKHKRSAGTIR